MSLFSKIRGTFETLFQIGKGGPNIKSTGGALESRNAADAAYANMRGADPLVADDLITLRHFDANNAAATGVTVVQMPLALATKVSTTIIPNNATVLDALIDVTTAYDAGALFNVQRTGDATVNPIANGDSDLGTIGTYHVPQIQSWGSTGAGTVTATLTNVPTVGVAVLYIAYVTPNDIS